MQLLMILMSVAMVTIIEAIALPKMPKPKVDLTIPQSGAQEVKNLKLPEERRKNSLFPKSLKKFVVTPEPQFVNPNIRATKKPLMKKLEFKKPLSIKNTEIDSASEEIDVKDNISYGINEVNTKDISKQESVEAIKEDSVESKETIDRPNEKTQKADHAKFGANNIKEDFATKPVEDFKLDDDKVDNNKHSEIDEQMTDRNEFIFLDSLTQKDQNIADDFEEYTTTEYILEPELPRERQYNRGGEPRHDIVYAQVYLGQLHEQQTRWQYVQKHTLMNLYDAATPRYRRVNDM
ncbi:uncharacterized protein LOC142980431 [Anticarsia gemmatalis]|uniref:uncharacterized protein LOC142980431 n=1 Tax=Anticarsia gemmatalis TaxID=129554 RepID=UPI003F776EE1